MYWGIETEDATICIMLKYYLEHAPFNILRKTENNAALLIIAKL